MRFAGWVDTEGAFDDYLGHISPKSRQTLPRKVRRYCAHAGSEEPWREFRTEDEVRRFHALARRAVGENPGVTMLDFTEGKGQHKSVFATGEAYCADVYYFRPSRRAAAALRAHIALRRIDAALMEFLRRTNLHQPMRRLVRRRAASAP